MRVADILIIGAGPAGMAAAVRARESGRLVTVLDDNPTAGGQIWRGGGTSEWFRKFDASGAELVTGARVFTGNAALRTLHVETVAGAFEIGYEALVLATGARELFLPFPGWTLPNVMGVGGVQALVKSGVPVAGKRIVVAGSGPLLLAVADYLRKHEASVPLIAEQASWSKLIPFSLSLGRHPGKLAQAATLKFSLGSTPYVPGSWVEAAEGEGRVEQVRIRSGSKRWTERCDYLAVAYGFWPSDELALLLGCETRESCVIADELQRTSVEGIYCAGESTGIGGVDLSLVEGQIAGLAASGRAEQARAHFPERDTTLRFAKTLNTTFAPREEIRSLAQDQTIVCRCEDVTLRRLKSANSWRAAKLHLRCGMGPCQGRICGPAVQFLFGWKTESVRPPIFPARVSSLISEKESINNDDENNDAMARSNARNHDGFSGRHDCGSRVCGATCSMAC